MRQVEIFDNIYGKGTLFVDGEIYTEDKDGEYFSGRKLFKAVSKLSKKLEIDFADGCNIFYLTEKQFLKFKKDISLEIDK